MKVKNLIDFASIPGGITQPGETLLSVLHPKYDNIDIQFCMGEVILEAGAESSKRRWSISSVYFVLSGIGLAKIENQSVILEKSSTIYVPAHTVRSFINTGSEKLQLLTILNQCWQDEFEEKVD